MLQGFIDLYGEPCARPEEHAETRDMRQLERMSRNARKLVNTLATARDIKARAAEDDAYREAQEHAALVQEFVTYGGCKVAACSVCTTARPAASPAMDPAQWAFACTCGEQEDKRVCTSCQRTVGRCPFCRAEPVARRNPPRAAGQVARASFNDAEAEEDIGDAEYHER